MPNSEAFIFTARSDAHECPVCRRVLDAATGVSLDPDDREPRIKVGDVTACAYCRTILLLTTLGFRAATEAEIDNLESPLRRLLRDFGVEIIAGFGYGPIAEHWEPSYQAQRARLEPIYPGRCSSRLPSTTRQ